MTSGSPVERAQIQTLVDQIVGKFSPAKVVLFGSYAYGTPAPHSDVDLLIVMPLLGRNVVKTIEILQQTNPPFAVDLLVRTPEQIAQRLAAGDFFLRDIVSKGTVLYDAAHAGMG